MSLLKRAGFFVFFILLLGFVFRSLLLHIFSDLIDWNDYPYLVWILFQNNHHILTGQLSSFFNGNIFYPDKGTMLFADLFLSQSFLALPFEILAKNPIFSFNISFFLTFALNVFAMFVFWRSRFKEYSLIFFAVVISVFSPFVIANINHYQMVTLWPFFLGLKFLLDSKTSFKNAFLVGLFASVQFLSGVYLAIFMMVGIFIWFCINLILDFSREKFLSLLKYGLCIIMTFSVFAGPFVYSYVKVEKSYHIKREYWEYVLYAAQISDYTFSSNLNSLESILPPMRNWNALDKHAGESGAFPGFLMIFLFIVGVARTFDKRKIGKSLDVEQVLFLTFTVIGFIFSLGPRLNFNGRYVGFLLPYEIFLKVIPFLEPIRATARWSFYFYFGLSFFCLVGLREVLKRRKTWIVLSLVTIFYLFEVMPINLGSSVQNYYPSEYAAVAAQCTSPRVLMEYPLSEDRKGANIITNLNYRTEIMLASAKHLCDLVNGYSGYIPTDYVEFETRLFNDVNSRNEADFDKSIKNRGVNLVKLNKHEIYRQKESLVENWLTNSSFAQVLLDDQSVLIVKVK